MMIFLTSNLLIADEFANYDAFLGQISILKVFTSRFKGKKQIKYFIIQ